MGRSFAAALISSHLSSSGHFCGLIDTYPLKVRQLLPCRYPLCLLPETAARSRFGCVLRFIYIIIILLRFSHSPGIFLASNCHLVETPLDGNQSYYSHIDSQYLHIASEPIENDIDRPSSDFPDLLGSAIKHIDAVTSEAAL
jgi:hypothetical protein